jgi:hypothetical protein
MMFQNSSKYTKYESYNILCWAWCYWFGIDVKEGQYGQCWIWCYDIGIDGKRINKLTENLINLSKVHVFISIY